MNLITIPEDKLLDTPDEILFSIANHNLQELDIDLNEPPTTTPEEISIRYKELMLIASLL